MIRGLLAAVLLAGCGGQAGGGGDDDARLAEAMCADLTDGMSMFQIHSQGVKYYERLGRSPDAAQLAAAQLEDRATSKHCPDFRSDFEATITYERWILPGD